MSPLRVPSEAEADAVFIPIYADLGCRLAQENATDEAAWRSYIDRCVSAAVHADSRIASTGTQQMLSTSGTASAHASKQAWTAETTMSAGSGATSQLASRM